MFDYRLSYSINNEEILDTVQCRTEEQGSMIAEAIQLWCNENSKKLDNIIMAHVEMVPATEKYTSKVLFPK